MSKLISARELELRIAAGNAPVLLDIRFAPGRTDGREAYAEAHIPGAILIDLPSELADAEAVGRGSTPLPDAAKLEADLRRWGIDADSAIVVYDDTTGAPAARAWWVLSWAGLGDVRLLNGGLAAWRREGFATEAGVNEPVGGGTVTVAAGALPSADIDDVAQGGRTLLDTRGKPAFAGGHIPHANNLPTAALQDADGLLLPPEQVLRKLADAGVKTGETAIASCGGGVAAAYVVLAAAEAGVDLALYAGSFSEWNGSGRAVAKEPAAA